MFGDTAVGAAVQFLTYIWERQHVLAGLRHGFVRACVPVFHCPCFDLPKGAWEAPHCPADWPVNRGREPWRASSHKLPTFATFGSCLQPCYQWWEVPYYWLGLKMYDLVAWGHTLGPWSHYVSRRQSLATFPTLCSERHQDGSSLKGTVGCWVTCCCFTSVDTLYAAG